MTYSCVDKANATVEEQGSCTAGHMMQQGQALVLVSADFPPVEVMAGATAIGFALAFAAPRWISYVIKGVKDFVVETLT